MKSTWRLFGVFLLLHLAGCTAYRPASLPGDIPSSLDQEIEGRDISVGDSVKIVLFSREFFTGIVVKISPEEIVLGKTGNFGYEETVVPVVEIASLQVEGVAGPFGLLKGMAAIGLVFVATVFILVVALGGPPGMN